MTLGFKLAKCDCDWAALQRVHRPWFLRIFFPQRRLYHCAECGRHMFASQRAIECSGKWHAAAMRAFTEQVSRQPRRSESAG